MYQCISSSVASQLSLLFAYFELIFNKYLVGHLIIDSQILISCWTVDANKLILKS